MPPATVTSEPAVPPLEGARFESLLLEFLAYLEMERGLSRNTLNAYRTDLLQYGDYLRDHEVDPLEIDAAGMAEYVADLTEGNGSGRSLAPSTVHRKTAALRSFYKHLRREDLVSDDPTAGLATPRRSK
ncbi:MAG: integrase/recombinase XerD, partial [Actinomycetota bacterium]|nr:integrase/recombinase XerD [Actinomycetota bacterium]